MKKLAALLISASALISGCTNYGVEHQNLDHEKKQQEPLDRNRNGLPDPLERKAVPTEPIIDRSLE